MPACSCRHSTDCGLLLALLELLFKGQSTIKYVGNGQRDRQTLPVYTTQNKVRRWLKHLCEIWWPFSKDMMAFERSGSLYISAQVVRRNQIYGILDCHQQMVALFIHLRIRSFICLFIYLLPVKQRQKKVKLEL